MVLYYVVFYHWCCSNSKKYIYIYDYICINHQPTIVGSYYLAPFDIYYIYVYIWKKYIYTCTWNCNDLVAVGKGLLLTGWPSKIRNHLSSRSILWLGITRWIHVLHGKWPSKSESVQIITHSIHAPDIEYLTITITNQPVMFIHIPVPWMVWDNDSSTWKPPKISDVSFQGDQHFQGQSGNGFRARICRSGPFKCSVFLVS